MRRSSSLIAGVTAALTIFGLLLHVTRSVSSQATEQGVIISEVAWAGTVHSANDEWIELHNHSDAVVDITGWQLQDSSGDLSITLAGFIEPGDFFLLERTDDTTVSDVAADLVYTGGLNNSGEVLSLVDGDANVVDSANGDGGEWPAGLGSPDYVSMERVSPWSVDDAQGWVTNDRSTTSGHDASGHPVNGTPRAANSSWAPVPEESDLAVTLRAPQSVSPGASLRYELEMANVGLSVAQEIVLTATLPSGVSYLVDDSDLATDASVPGYVTWLADQLQPGDMHSFAMTGTVALTAEGLLTTTLHVSSATPETALDNNVAEVTTLVATAGLGNVLINSVLYDGYELNDADEAVQLVNVGGDTILLHQWVLGDGSRDATIDDGVTIAPSETVWLARDAQAFQRQFGFAPDVELASWPGFANVGDEVFLRDPEGRLVDAVVYKEGDATSPGWSGSALWPYRVTSLFAEEGQILYRKIDEVNGLPVADTDGPEDWAQAETDPISGRKVQYPGWQLMRFWQPVIDGASEAITIAVAPDNAYEAVAQQIAAAQQTIQIETLTMENVAIGQALVAAAGRGVSVTVLLEGDPTGGIDDHERFICQLLEAQGGQCWFMIRDDASRVHDRYRYLHAKIMIVDGERAVISSENLSPNSLPDDDKTDGTWGRRGLVLITESRDVVSRLMEIFSDDLAPAEHLDLFRWRASHPEYGAPAEHFVPITITGGTTYTVRYPEPLLFQDVTSTQVFQAPENILRRRDGLLALLNQAGPGDSILAQQLTERRQWGSSSSTPLEDPNPRLEAMIGAARRGATVRLLLDAFFDDNEDALSNHATCRYVNDIADLENLRIHCALANPTGLGIHNKMVLVYSDGRGWVHVGSWNGTEQSTKGNRELALLVQSDAAHAFLASLFEQDWPHTIWFPITLSRYLGPANYPLISELMYDPTGADDAEYIELANGSSRSVDLSGWALSDAVLTTDFEDARRFPDNTLLARGSTVVVALNATGFEARFGFLPDLEILNSHEAVPDMIDDAAWGEPEAILQMGNAGDEILLRDPLGVIVDAIAYGSGHVTGTISCALLPGAGYVLERVPYWRDTDDCTTDFRAWPLPSPGMLP